MTGHDPAAIASGRVQLSFLIATDLCRETRWTGRWPTENSIPAGMRTFAGEFNTPAYLRFVTTDPAPASRQDTQGQGVWTSSVVVA
jgi:hypothetical protein